MAVSKSTIFIYSFYSILFYSFIYLFVYFLFLFFEGGGRMVCQILMWLSAGCKAVPTISDQTEKSFFEEFPLDD